MLLKCPKCGNGLSPSARNCPKCGSPANEREYRRQYGPCRRCGAVLERARHREVYETQYQRDGNTHYRDAVRHVPCAQCGEPRPFQTLLDNVFVIWVALALIALVLIGWVFPALTAL